MRLMISYRFFCEVILVIWTAIISIELLKGGHPLKVFFLAVLQDGILGIMVLQISMDYVAFDSEAVEK
ncbi:hypothetical protein AUP07_0706 [methanogenic archaeon mixed culture ISO4-G1]|nr:hypothetical protein AUP07_0706 [methanogenic archaeon mixed culture ISO4-G1]